MEKLLNGIVLIAICLSLGCTVDQDVPAYESNARLKRTLLYGNVEATNPIAIVDEYEYDILNRISKVSSPLYQDGKIVGTGKYELYSYDAQGQLIEIAGFNANFNSPTGFIHLTNRRLFYGSNGLKEKEIMEYPQINSAENSLFFYSGNRLIKSEQYQANGQLAEYTLFEYQGSKLIKERSFTPTGELNRTTEYKPQKDGSEMEVVYVGPSKVKAREVRKTYDANRNLLMLQSTELAAWSSAMSFVMRYEYF
jgi:hypothetical protein